MKAASVLVFAFATSVAGAPTIFTSLPEYYQEVNRQALRNKRSKFGHGYFSYGSASPIASYSPYQWNMPVQGYVNPYAYQSIFPGCGRGYYRTEDHHNGQEMMSFSDKDQEHSTSSKTVDETASSAQIAPVSAAGLQSIGQLVAPENGPAYGVFSNVRDGCNVPLLFSCSPSIVPGRIVKSPMGMGYGYGPYGYRDVGEMAYDPPTSFHDDQGHDGVGTGEADHVAGHQ